MRALLNGLIVFIAIEHVWFFVLEVFLWRKPFAWKSFKSTQAIADSSAPLAMNQGLYNGFLVAGLVWSLAAADPVQQRELQIFFLSCVAAAGVFGGLTAFGFIFFGQGLPALVALGVLFAM